VTWYINGNGNTFVDPTKNYFLGTIDEKPLIIKTNQAADDSEKVRVNPDGNVGIGKAPASGTPYRLDVAGPINATDIHKNGAPLSASQWTDTPGGITYGGGSVGIGKAPSTTYELDVAGTINVTDIHKDGAPLRVSQWKKVSGGISYTGGNVGIGTTQPENAEEWNKVLDVLGADAGGAKLSVRTESVDAQVWAAAGEWWGAPTGMAVGTKSDHALSFATGGSSKMTIDPQGNVGIGTSENARRLHISTPGSDVLMLQSTRGGAGSTASLDFQTYATIGQIYPTASVRAIDDGTYSSHIVFSTKASGANNNALQERLRIASNGYVGIGTTERLHRPLQVQGHEIHSGGSVAGYSFSNRETAAFVEGPGGGERWVWYASGGVARLWSGADKLAVALDPTVQTAVTIGPGTNGRLKVRHIDGKHWQNDSNEGLHLNWDTGQPVNIGQNLNVRGNAYKPGGGFWAATSDVRLKKSVRSLKGALEKLSRLRGVSFEWKNPQEQGNLRGEQMGLVAQEVEEVFPEWIDADSKGYKSMTVRGFEALVVEAFKELKAELEDLRAILRKE
jgi:hypothetical protein